MRKYGIRFVNKLALPVLPLIFIRFCLLDQNLRSGETPVVTWFICPDYHTSSKHNKLLPGPVSQLARKKRPDLKKD